MASIRICILEADLVSSDFCALWRDRDAPYANKFTCVDGKSPAEQDAGRLAGASTSDCTSLMVSSD